MSTLIYPGARFRPVRFAGVTGRFAVGPLGWVLHVACMNGSPFSVFDGSAYPNRRVSTGWVAKDGRVEQYLPADAAPWAQAAGNAAYWAWETEGQPEEPLTAEQIDSLARIHIWHEAPDDLANAPGQAGIGVHYMGGRDWGGHSCPDPAPGGQGPRSRQRIDILDRVAQLRHTPGPIPSPQTGPAPAFPLPAGWYFGPKDGPAWSVSGYYSYRHDLATWQAQMAHRGWSIAVDGLYGPQTAGVARAFQAEKGLTVDGLIGPQTWAAAWTAPVTP